MTAAIARQPLHPLSMSSSQRGPRRLSARLQEKEDEQIPANGLPGGPINKTSTITSNGLGTKRIQERPPTTKKRKIDYNEEHDGFLFTRAKTRRQRSSASRLETVGEPHLRETPVLGVDPTAAHLSHEVTTEVEPKKKGRNKMSFSTPTTKPEVVVRRSKRLSDEHRRRDGSPQRKARRKESEEGNIAPNRPVAEELHGRQDPSVVEHVQLAEEEHSATKISLPFADTPVIRRNKAFREGRSGKGERRSSLGLRGRRASSLIDTGTSNALPHHEVEIADFYKHIAEDGLPEPRRMRQLLTWCATRAMDDKPMGTEFEDQSARLAARVIQEELLKDFANRSEMSDWFGREDAPPPVAPLPIRPNPKNMQNAAKIKELEEQIERLKVERHSLESLLRPPSIPSTTADQRCDFHSKTFSHDLDTSHLSPSDMAILQSAESTSDSTSIEALSARLHSITTSIGPTIDVFADGIHTIAQYREAAEHTAGRVLRICADRLEQRERGGTRRNTSRLDTDVVGGKTSSGQDEVGSVLRSLSRLDRDR